MKKGQERIISAEHGRTLPAAVFPAFERRPVNYYRDMLTEEEAALGLHLSETELNARIEELLSAEKARLHDEHAMTLQRQYELGLEKGQAEATAELSRALQLLTDYARVLQSEKQEVAARTEQSSIDLAFMLARKILDTQIEAHPELVTGIARNAVRQVMDCERVALKVNPTDLEYLKAAQADIEGLLSKQAQLEFRPDSTIERGGCMVETERGVLDARMSSQLDTLLGSLKERITGVKS